jgi:hypothetical protein
MAERPKVFFSRPADKSLKAFGEWLNEMTVALGGSTTDDLTPEELKADWLECWGDQLTEEERG